MVEKGPELAGFLYARLISETADLWFGRRIGAFFSGQEIPFPGNGDRSRQRLGSKGDLLRRKPEHLVARTSSSWTISRSGRNATSS